MFGFERFEISAQSTLGALLGVVLLAAAPAAAATKYKVTVLQPLPGFTRGAVGDQSFGINAAGQSVGRQRNGPEGDRAAVWNLAGQATQLATPEGTWFSKADGINSSGVISGDIGVGEVGNFDTRRAVRWATPDSFQYILPDSGHFSAGDIINNNGWIGGIEYRASFDDATFQAYVWSPDGTIRRIDPALENGRIEWFGTNSSNIFVGQQAIIGDDSGASFGAAVWNETDGVTVLPGLGGIFLGATGINDIGIIIGGEYDGDVTDIGLWWDAARQVHTLGFLPGFTTSAPNAINNHGLVVGWSAPTATCDGFADFTCRRATLWTLDGGVTNLNDLIDPRLGYTLLFANGINDSGAFYGEAIDRDGRRFLFAAQTVPEPASWALLIAGFGLTGAVLRRRRMPQVAS